ncbi:MAG: hypothetical protein HND51_12515 [Chloroflexi bacterium]|nr:hypothetical protein [Chloroflexota bacterium]
MLLKNILGGDQAKRDHTQSEEERGQMLVIFAVGLLLLVLLLGLVVDVGGMSLTYARAQLAIDEAAIAASQGVNLQRFYTHNELQLQPSVAAGRAGQFLSTNGGGLVELTSIHVTPDQVFLTGQATYSPFIIGFLTGDVTMTVSGESRPDFGIDERDQ